MSSVYIPKAPRHLIAEQARNRCGYCLTRAAITGGLDDRGQSLVGLRPLHFEWIEAED